MTKQLAQEIALAFWTLVDGGHSRSDACGIISDRYHVKRVEVNIAAMKYAVKKG